MNQPRFRASLFIILALCLLPAISAAKGKRHDDAVAAARTVRTFYKYHFAHSKYFTAQNIKRRRAWFSAELYRLLLNELQRAALHSKTHPDDAPYMEGDPFTNAQEYPDSFRLGQASVQDNESTVPVTFFWHNNPENSTVRVEVIKQKDKWLVHNIFYTDDADLLRQLRRPVYDSNVAK